MKDSFLQSNWNQLKGKVREEWGKLTEDDLSVVQGQAEQLVGKIQERYSLTKAKAELQVDAWLSKLENAGKTETSQKKELI